MMDRLILILGSVFLFFSLTLIYFLAGLSYLPGFLA